MNETELWARVGRQAVRIEQQDAAYTQLLAIFGDVIAGRTDPRRVLINRTAGSCSVGPVGSVAMMPATINGVPACDVYAPFDEVKPAPDLPPLADPPGGSD